GINSSKLIKVGFAAESENLVENSKTKIESKNLDFIVANDITAAHSGFSVDTNKVTIIHADGTTEALPLMSKYDVAHSILDRVKSGF
ncbi:MAG TPA: bifunctional 4'-phosphopantothenoylcysteine decarboxylase/phosphopantothenoylcysteine synthetase, partial [Dehalococcoidia bacterium]|nr:bifunctional 4'-phosphopantothenoylcysteine decarboxylase/phosphopantothenoylcysteine synthetase [Dehalococcoidia bacterium]